MKYLHLAYLAYAVIYEDIQALWILSFWMIILSTAFYVMSYKLVSGFARSRLSTEPDVEGPLHLAIYMTTTIAMFYSGIQPMMIVATYTVPFILISIMIEVTIILAKTGRILLQYDDD